MTSGERRFVDLHAHSTASDGTLSPRELIDLAERCRLAAVALTDHDTVYGLAEAAAAAGEHADLAFVPGIELSAEPPCGTLHVLGLGIDADAPSILEAAAFMREGRRERNRAIVEKLQSLGLPINMEDVLAAAGFPCGDARTASGREGGTPSGGSEAPSGEAADADAVIGRMHIAAALHRKGCVPHAREAFRRYIAKGGPAYVNRRRLTPRRSADAIRAAGGLAVAAHPVQLGCGNRAQYERVFRDLRRAGIEAIEAYHSDHTPELTRLFIDLARKLGMGLTGGSDFHGTGKPDVRLGYPRVPAAVVPEELLENGPPRP